MVRVESETKATDLVCTLLFNIAIDKNLPVFQCNFYDSEVFEIVYRGCQNPIQDSNHKNWCFEIISGLVLFGPEGITDRIFGEKRNIV